MAPWVQRSELEGARGPRIDDGIIPPPGPSRRHRSFAPDAASGLNFVLLKPGFAQHFETVLAEPRLQAFGCRAGAAEAHRQIGVENLAFARMSGPLEEAARRKLRIGEEIVEARHARGRDFKFAKPREPFVRGLVGDALAGQLVDRDDVLGARRDAVEARIADHLRLAHHGPEFPPVGLRVGHHAQIAVLGFVRTPPGRRDAGVAERPQRRHEVVAKQMLAEHKSHHLFEHRDFNELPAPGAFAREQRRRHRAGDGKRAGLVGQDHRRVTRLARDLRHQGRNAGLALNHVIVGRLAAVRAAVAIAMQRGVDEARIFRAHRLVSEAELLDFLRPHRMDEHIRSGDQPPERVLGGIDLEIENERALAAVQPHEQRRHAGRSRRAGVPGGVALRRLDLDHVGAHVAEHLRGQRAGDDRSEVEYADAR